MRRQLDVGIIIRLRSPLGLGRVRVPRATRTAARPQRGVRQEIRAGAGADACSLHVSE